jgi:universal stress protein A
MADPRPRILAVTDLSDAGDRALVEAARRALAGDAQLGVVHAIPSLDAIRPLFPQRLVDDIVEASQLPTQAEATLQHRIEALGVAGDVELFVEPGTTAEVALAVATRWQPGLIVIGAPEDGAAGVQNVVRHATSPVLVARTSPATKRVVVGTDFSDPSLPAIRAAADAAALLGGELVVVHAIEVNPHSVYGVVLPTMFSGSVPTDLHDAAQHRLDAALAKLGVEAQTQVYVGPPAKALIQAASSYDAELLVIGTHGRTGVTRFLLGSVAETVLQRAPCSVLVARLG